MKNLCKIIDKGTRHLAYLGLPSFAKKGKIEEQQRRNFSHNFGSILKYLEGLTLNNFVDSIQNDLAVHFL